MKLTIKFFKRTWLSKLKRRTKIRAYLSSSIMFYMFWKVGIELAVTICGRSASRLQRLWFCEKFRIESNSYGLTRWVLPQLTHWSIGNNLAKVRKCLEENYSLRIALQLLVSDLKTKPYLLLSIDRNAWRHRRSPRERIYS